VTSRIVEEDAPAEYLNEIAPPATAGGFPFVPVTFTLAKDQGPLESLSPTALSRRALFQYAQTHGVPDDFTKEFLDREDLAGHLHPFEISSGNEASTADILNDPQAFDPQTNAVTLKLRKSFADKLLDEWEQNKPYTTRIAEDYQAGKPAGTIAYDVVAPPVAAAARGVEIASRPVRAASTLVNAPEQAKLALARRIAGDPDAHPLDVLKDAPSAALHELATGEGDPRYENPLTTVTQDVARQTLAKINPTLPGFARVVTDVVGDPLVLLGVAGKIGKAGELARISRAARAGEEVADSATVESRLASIADSIEQRTGVRPSLKVQPDNSIRVAADFGGSPVEFTVPPGGKGLRLPSLPEAPAPKIEPVVFDHPELGRVVVADSQEDVPRGFMRVAEMENPEAEHVVNSSRLALPSSASTRPGLGAYALDLWNASRSFKTSYDLSAPRNSLVLSLTRPVHAARAFSAQVKALRSEGAAMNFMRAIDADAIKPVADEAGLQLTRLDGSVAGREEMFRSAIAERIPGVRASERAFHTYLNQLRFSVFKDYALSHPGATPEDLKGVARAINFFTGRGSFGRLENSKIVTGLSEAFYAPRLNLSYVQSLASPAMGTAAARKFAARHVAQFVGTGLAVGGLIKATSKQTGIDFEADPRSSDFGKIKVGRNRVNLFGGFSALARYTAQAITGEGKSDSGRVYEKSRVQTALDYGRTRLHPSAGFILDLKTGETVDRRKLYKDGSPDASALIRDALMPLSAGDIYDAVEEDRAEGGSGLKGLAFAPAALTGFDVQTRTPKPATDNQQDYIFQLAEHSKQDADEVSRRLTGRAVDKLSADEAKQVIDELKKSARLPARGRPLVGVEKYVQPLDAERRGPSQQSIP
jgi:hypothetical protein